MLQSTSAPGSLPLPSAMCMPLLRQRILMSFDTLGLAPTLLSAVLKAGFTEPTSVQAAAIPKALAGHDLMVSSQTGSGKTAAFMLPALNRISNMPPSKSSGVQVLVLTPTRELAMRSEEHTSELQSLIRISYAVFCLKKKQHT